MKQFLIFGIFLCLLEKRKTTAREISERFEVSTRSIYRYIDAMSMAGLPILTENGRNGGISLAKEYRLESSVLSENEKRLIRSILEKNTTNENSCEIKKILSVI